MTSLTPRTPHPTRDLGALFTRLDAWVTPRRVSVLFGLLLLVLACENTLTFPLSVPYMRQLTGHAYLDLYPFCSAPDLYAALSAFGAAGRRMQLVLLGSVDILIPSLSGLFGASALTLLSRDLRARSAAYRVLVLVPVAATLLDFTENLGIAVLTSSYPARLDGLAAVTGFTTGIKFVAYGLTLLCVVVLSVRRGFMRSNHAALR